LPSKLRKIISGGQTGADRAAWDAAIEAGIATGGFVPVGRQAEDGPIPGKYPHLIETGTSDTATRTRLNVIDSDATLLFSHGPPTGGSRLTAELAAEHFKPLLHIDLSRAPSEGTVERVAYWLRSTNIYVLNVAGPRASEDPLIYDAVRELLNELFSSL
jgi:predicted Rossmann fold nucleotide-binding protein DprA/Smf involved in DNA uptake